MADGTSPSRFLTDEALLGECRRDVYRGSGPGGQKRNKTSNAVRLVHLPTGTVVTATEWRSLAVNQLHALRRLRLRLAADFRDAVALADFAPPDWLVSIRRQGRLEVSHRHALYPATGGLVLDLLEALGGNPAAVAVNLGISTTGVIWLLQSEAVWWAAAGRIRAGHGLGPLSRRD